MRGLLSLYFLLLLLSTITFPLIMPVAKPEKSKATLSADSPNLGIVNIAASKTVVGRGATIDFGINVTSYWNETETFNATFYANSTVIAEISNILVEGQNSTIVTCKWNSGPSYGNYSISASITAVPNETNLSDNFIGNLWMFVTIMGDINADKWVDIYDAILLAGLFQTELSHICMVYPWHPPPLSPLATIADFNGDGFIDIYDAIILAGHFGQHWT